MSLTDNEIIKALDVCSKSTNGCSHSKYTCEDCYLNGQPMCSSVLLQDALDLINRQKAEIEKLKEASEEAVSCFHRMESLYNIKCMELKVAKTEAYKEIIEKLKSKLCICDDNFNPVVTEKEIDDTFKEMVAMINEKHI